MIVLLLLPVLLSFLLLAAHFFYHGSMIMVGVSLLLPLTLLARRRWVPWVIQLALVLGAFEWLSTLMLLINQREEEGRPWKAAAIILGSVIVFTLASGLVFISSTLRRTYGRAAVSDSRPAETPGSSCALGQ
jgi:hypothetical protein